MTINETTISNAIYSICFAFLCAGNTFGARLFVEDRAPEGLKVAAKESNPEEGWKVLSPEEAKALEEEMKRRGRIRFGAAQIGTLVGMAMNAEQCASVGYDDVGDHIIIFYESLIKAAKSEADILMLAFEFVAHELRHVEQFRWLRAHGIDPTSALQAESGYEYGQGPLERDAWAVQKGATTPIDEAMACFLH